MAIENHDGTIVVTGEDIRPVADLIILRGWKLAATMKIKHGMNSAVYRTVKQFNAYYGTSGAKTWADVLKITTDVLAEIAAERKAAQS